MNELVCLSKPKQKLVASIVVLSSRSDAMGYYVDPLGGRSMEPITSVRIFLAIKQRLFKNWKAENPTDQKAE